MPIPGVLSEVSGIIDKGSAEIPRRDLKPLEPNIYDSYEPVNFKLPDYIDVRP